MDVVRMLEQYSNQMEATGKKIQEAKDARAAVEDQITEETLKQQRVLSDLRAKQQDLAAMAAERSGQEAKKLKVKEHNDGLKEDVSVALKALEEASELERAHKIEFAEWCCHWEAEFKVLMRADISKNAYPAEPEKNSSDPLVLV